MHISKLLKQKTRNPEKQYEKEPITFALTALAAKVVLEREENPPSRPGQCRCQK